MRLKAFIPARRDLARASSNLIVILPTKDIIVNQVEGVLFYECSQSNLQSGGSSLTKLR